MADDVDNAEVINNLLLDRSIKAIREEASKPEAFPTGECLFCEQPLPAGMRWCGTECRDDWQKEINNE